MREDLPLLVSPALVFKKRSGDVHLARAGTDVSAFLITTSPYSGTLFPLVMLRRGRLLGVADGYLASFTSIHRRFPFVQVIRDASVLRCVGFLPGRTKRSRSRVSAIGQVVARMSTACVAQICDSSIFICHQIVLALINTRSSTNWYYLLRSGVKCLLSRCQDQSSRLDGCEISCMMSRFKSTPLEGHAK